MAKLVRKKDKLVKEGEIEFVEFDKFDRGKNIHTTPKVGYACIVNRNRQGYTWMTTVITELISNKEFKTKNSHYKIKE